MFGAFGFEITASRCSPALFEGAWYTGSNLKDIGFKRRIEWLIIVALVALVLGGASFIVANNPVGSVTGAPAGFIH
jgi:hypothetical protein